VRHSAALTAGTVNFDTVELTLVDVFTTTTTTNTDLLTQNWELIGVPAVVAAPEPRGLDIARRRSARHGMAAAKKFSAPASNVCLGIPPTTN